MNQRSGPLRRFFIDDIPVNDETCLIRGQEARYIRRVLRMAAGDRMILMDRKGHRFQAVIRRAGRDEILVTLERSLPRPRSSPVEIHLCQALLKARQMDYLIQKTSELGLDTVFPFLSERTVVRLKENMRSAKMNHWRGVARSAATQCDRIRPLDIAAPQAFVDLLDHMKTLVAHKIILWEGEGVRDIKGLLRALSPAKRCITMIGPEGGFTEEEVSAARKVGFTSVSLGHRILRAETAAITMVALLQYEWGDLGIPPDL
jgi:16S rRNA (uracil1498-N3)-methyltransferase